MGINKNTGMSNRRYMVYCKSGRKFMVEEIGDPHVNWGNVIPGKGLENVYAKVDDVINEKDSQITVENGFKNIVTLDPGTSPLGYIDVIDKLGIERIDVLED